ncbi:hypothetical protein psyc5s11_33210 [Clostridium gelidum]|uniref:H-type lectin domain-containing protein n=1 Tax=Clostridium gelidum TaxID=704125 RepID=A0ABN6IYQ6_9CLOT|nr:H-type lectin domain-containing protein [Clostridium gelidum]BCZ47254.1 hypothetical protein psyc5s11_33210 [Clostridium gelidum]
MIRSGSVAFNPGIPGYHLNNGDGTLRAVEQYVKFKKEFTEVPEVVAGIREVQATITPTLYYRIYVHSITKSGFVLRAETWDRSKIDGIVADWLAYDNE